MLLCHLSGVLAIRTEIDILHLEAEIENSEFQEIRVLPLGVLENSEFEEI